MKKWLQLLFLLPFLLRGQQEPTSAYSTQGTFMSAENDLWFIDRDSKWVPFGNVYTLNRPMISVSNVTDLVRAPAWSNSLAKVIQTLGYYTPGDGGAGIYSLASMTSTNMGRFASTNAAYMWQLIGDPGGVRLRQYGAKGDGTNDDTQAVKDWLHDTDRKIGLASAGVYSINPIFTEPNAVITIQGMARFGMTAPNISSLYPGNCATFRRRNSSGSTNALINVVSNAVLNAYSLVFDGNKTGDPTATNAYLFLVNGGGASEIESCYFSNSAGHGIGIVGPAGNWTVIRNCRIYDVNRAVRLNQTSGVTINNVHIQFCRENGLWLTGFANLTRCHQLFISDCAENGFIFEGSQHNRFTDCEVRTTFKSSIFISTTNSANSTDNAFFQCSFQAANAASSALLGASPYAAGTYAAVMVAGNSGSDYANRYRFDGCVFGDLFGSSPSRGLYNLQWTAPTGSHYPWEMWMFSNNQHVWNSGWLSDINPGITNTVGEVNNLRANNEFASQFGKSGAINSAGWRMDIVEAGAAGAPNAVIYANSTNHKMLRDTTGYGSPIAPTLLPETVELLPAQPEPKPIPLVDP